MIYLHKLLPLLVSPLGLVTTLLLLNLWLKKRVLTVLALLVLLVSSLEYTARWVWSGLEADYPYREVSTLQQHDAVIVLSGMLRNFSDQGQRYEQWEDADRFFAGLEILRAGKAQKIIFTGGKMPWSQARPEGEVLREAAIAMGVADTQILLAGEAANTADEAAAVARLMREHGIRSAILVTSSFHMPRARLLFERAGISLEPYATDYKYANREFEWLELIPSGDGFKDNSEGLREYIGRWYYRLKFG